MEKNLKSKNGIGYFFLMKNIPAQADTREDRCCILYMCRYINGGEETKVVKEGSMQVHECECYTGCSLNIWRQVKHAETHTRRLVSPLLLIQTHTQKSNKTTSSPAQQPSCWDYMPCGAPREDCISGLCDSRTAAFLLSWTRGWHW